MLAGSAQAQSVTLDGITYTVDADGQTAAVAYAGRDITEAHIPATVNIDGTGYPVTAIGDNAFYRCDALQSIILPEGLQSIGTRAFDSCTSLQSVTFPEGLQTIGWEAFYGCPLQDITCLAATPPAIDGSSFDNDAYANAALHVPAGAWAAYQADPDWERLIRYPEIGGVEYYIGFATQEASVSGTDESITTANILASVEYDGTEYPVTAIGDYAFWNCTALQSITFPEGLQSIGYKAFSNCDALQSVTFPEGLQTIGREAFYGCNALQSIILPQGLQSIGNDAFSYCTSLQSITCHAATPPSIEDDTFDYDTYDTAVLTVPEGAEAAYQVAQGWKDFFHYPQIGGVQYYVDFATQTASVTDAYYGITETTIPATVEYEGADYPVTAIGSSAFQDCYDLRSITLPQGLQSIDNYAFFQCRSLQSIDLPQGLQTIGESAFFHCESLQSIALPEGLQSIDEAAFAGCHALRSVTLPGGLRFIGQQAFRDCLLKDVACLAAVPPGIYNDSFDTDTYATATFHVPSDAVASYQAAEGWKLFQHIVGDLPSTAISSVAADASIATYTDGIITLSGTGDITVYAQSGAQVRHAADATTLSLAGLPHGIYIISIAQDGQRQVMKVVR